MKHLGSPSLLEYVNMNGQISKLSCLLPAPTPLAFLLSISLSLTDVIIPYTGILGSRFYPNSWLWDPHKFRSQTPAVEERAPPCRHMNDTARLTFPQEMPWLPRQVAPPAVSVAAWVQGTVLQPHVQGSSSTARRGAPAATSVSPH